MPALGCASVRCLPCLLPASSILLTWLRLAACLRVHLTLSQAPLQLDASLSLSSRTSQCSSRHLAVQRAA